MQLHLAHHGDSKSNTFCIIQSIKQ